MDSSEIEKRSLVFDEYVHSENGVEFWYARDIMKPLGYARWENFEVAIQRAQTSCKTSNVQVDAHFREVTKMVTAGVAARRVKDYKLTRYACYLIAQNGDVRKNEIALAQAYFAVQTRKQEIIEQRVAELQRLHSRKALSETEKQLAGIAFERGVDSKGFAQIKSRGDKELFGGHDTRDMKKRLGVPGGKPLADVLPNVTIAAKNLATSMTAYNTEQKDLQGAIEIGNEHVENNRSVRGTLVDRGIRPEDLPAEEDAKKVERRVKSDERKLAYSEKGFLKDESEPSQDGNNPR